MSPARDLFDDALFDLNIGDLDPPARLADHPPRTQTAQEQAVTDRRKLAIGRAILAHGPQSAAQIGRLCEALGLPVAVPDQYVRTLRAFIDPLYLKPVRWDLTPAGRAWVLERESK